MNAKNPHAVALGRRGGKAGTGVAKARENAREAGRLGGLARARNRKLTSALYDNLSAHDKAILDKQIANLKKQKEQMPRNLQ